MVTINDRDYKEIIQEVGYPIVKEEDLEFSREDIQDLFIYPALRDYFTWFPKTETLSVQIAGSFSIPFPDEFTFGVIDSRLNTSPSSGGSTSSPFINEIVYSVSKSGGVYGTNNDYGFTESRLYERAEKLATADSVRAFKLKVSEADKLAKGYTNISGELIITWAKWSYNFDDVIFRRKSEVINLAKSYMLKGFAQLRGQMTSDVGVEFDTGLFLDRAEELKEEVKTKWKEIAKIVVIRN